MMVFNTIIGWYAGIQKRNLRPSMTLGVRCYWEARSLVIAVSVGFPLLFI